ncbi:Transposable element P transposase, partial [Frankliniella fusca]
ALLTSPGKDSPIPRQVESQTPVLQFGELDDNEYVLAVDSTDEDDNESQSSLVGLSNRAQLSGESNALLTSPGKDSPIPRQVESQTPGLQFGELDDNEYVLAVDSADEDDNESEGISSAIDLFCDEPEFSSTTTSQETQLVEPLQLDLLSEILSNLLSDSSWIIDKNQERCRLSLLGPSANAVVERGICWCNGEAEVYIYNRPLPRNSFLWGKEVKNANDETAVAFYMLGLATALSETNICCGIEDYPEYWSSQLTDGYIESAIYRGKTRFRTHACALAVPAFLRSGCCVSCKALQEIFRKRRWKSVHLKGTDVSKTTNKSLSKEELETKASSIHNVMKNQKKKIIRLEEKIRKMINKDTIEIDEHLGKDFMKILRKNADKMTGIQKLFWKEQMKALGRQNNPKSMTWNPMMVRIALHLQNISPAAVNFMRDAGFISLPCNRTLYDFTHFVDNTEGIQHEILNLLEKKIEPLCVPENERYFNLVFDEINIKSDLVRNKHGELIGYLKLNEVEIALKELENEMASAEPQKPLLAKKVLVYMLQGININIHEVVGLFSTTDVTSVQIFSRTWDLIYHLEARSMKIICLICDGASPNKKFFNMHVPWDSQVRYVYATKHLYAEEIRPIFFMVDPPHLLKTIRNCLSNSFAHFCSRKMWKNNQTLTWKALEKLYEVDIPNKFRIHKLTKDHVRLTSFTRMRVSLAAQVCSQSVADSLRKYKDDPRFEGPISSELITFISICNRLFDCLNGSNDAEGTRNKINSDLVPFTSCQDERFDFLQSVLRYFQDWQSEVLARDGKLSLEEKKRMQISPESYESLHITIHGFCAAVQFLLKNTGIKSIQSKDFNQDKLEQEFGLFRMSFGANNHPTLQNLIQKTLTHHVQRSAALPVKGNIKGTRKTLVVDESPLPKRRKL